jgi:uncharacterized coiled-coil DUF342 family protein
MTVNELYSIADRIDQLIFEAEGFNKSAYMILGELSELADSLRDDADILAEAIAGIAKENA